MTFRILNSPCVEQGRLPFATSDREHSLGTSSRQICSIRLAFRLYSGWEPRKTTIWYHTSINQNIDTPSGTYRTDAS